VLFFDLDNTLYPHRLGVVTRIDDRINEYLERRLGVPSAEVDALRRRFWAEHGTTLRGLTAHHAIDADDYLAYIHDIEIEDLLQPDLELRALLARLPGRKVVFSNAARTHARRVLDRLGLADAFETVIALEDLGYVPKPDAEAFRIALTHAETDGKGCALIDDLTNNLAAAKRLGMRTIWVAEHHDGSPLDAALDSTIDHVIGRVHEIEGILAAGEVAARG
jgi:putative hydrolase of the HAD superfamily